MTLPPWAPSSDTERSRSSHRPRARRTTWRPSTRYLAGLVVRSAHRRRGVGHELTLARLAWIAARSKKAYYFANERNRASIELHAAAGLTELGRDFHHPAVRFTEGLGILFECELSRGPKE